MDGEDLTNLQMNTLLNHFTTYYVQLRRDEKKEALSSWKPIVEAVLAYVRERSRERNDYLASLQNLYSGSSYEGTKVGEPDEFDLMLVMKSAVFREVKELPGVNKPPTGFTIGILTTRESENPCCAKDVKADFAKLVKEAILQNSFENVTVKCCGPAVTLKITNENGREYSVDLTLAIKYESWPEDAEEWRTRHRYGWPTQSLIQEILQDGCHLVVKKPKEKNLQEEKGFYVRYSFSEAEKKLFNKGGHEENSCRKQVLRILKALRKELNLGPLNSYHLKTVLLYECEANPDPSQWSHKKLSERFIGLLQRLENCLFQNNCPHYFIKHLNLFDKQFSHKRCLDLAKKVRKIILKQGKLFTYYVIFQSLQLSAEQTIVESLMETLQQVLEPILQNETMSRLEQTLWQALEQALRHVQGQVQEQTQLEALQVLQDEAEALGEGVRQALVQERGKEFCQVLEQALLEGLEQVPEQAFEQGQKQALGKAVGQALGKALGQALGQIFGQALGIILEQFPEEFIPFFTSLYIFILKSCGSVE